MVGYVDLSNLAADLTRATGGSVAANTKALVASVTAQTEFLAQAYAPVRRGQLRGSIHSYPVNGGMGGVVVADAPYASFVEFGTGTRGEFPGQMIIIRPRTAKFLRFQGRDGRWHYAKEVHSPGMAPRPFMRPALERAVVPLAEGLGDIGVLTIVKGPNAPETLRNAPATGWH